MPRTVGIMIDIVPPSQRINESLPARRKLAVLIDVGLKLRICELEPVTAATDVWVDVGVVDIVMAVPAAAGGGCDVTEVGERPGF